MEKASSYSLFASDVHHFLNKLTCSKQLNITVLYVNVYIIKLTLTSESVAKKIKIKTILFIPEGTLLVTVAL